MVEPVATVEVEAVVAEAEEWDQGTVAEETPAKEVDQVQEVAEARAVPEVLGELEHVLQSVPRIVQ